MELKCPLLLDKEGEAWPEDMAASWVLQILPGLKPVPVLCLTSFPRKLSLLTQFQKMSRNHLTLPCILCKEFKLNTHWLIQILYSNRDFQFLEF